jgi:FkbM family methyltransferase
MVDAPMKKYLEFAILKVLRAYPTASFRLWRLITKSLPISAAVANIKMDIQDTKVADLGRSLAIMFPAQDTVIISSLLRAGVWEAAELNSVIREIRPTAQYYVYDVGANVGLFSIQLEIAMRGLSRGHQIISYHCFEPVSQIRMCLEHNLRCMSAEVSIYQYAIGAVNEKQNIYLDSSNGGNNSLISVAVERKRSVECIDVRRFDTIIEEQQIPIDKPVILKVDIQGFEPLALSCTPEALWDKIEIALIEFTPALLLDVTIADAFCRVCIDFQRFSTCYRVSDSGNEEIDIKRLWEYVGNYSGSHVNLLFVK